jgi:hypothetical protein
MEIYRYNYFVNEFPARIFFYAYFSSVKLSVYNIFLQIKLAMVDGITDKQYTDRCISLVNFQQEKFFYVHFLYVKPPVYKFFLLIDDETFDK